MHLKNRSDYFILLQKIRIQVRTARDCLTETVGFTLGETLVKSKKSSLSQRCPLYSDFICIKNLKTLE